MIFVQSFVVRVLGAENGSEERLSMPRMYNRYGEAVFLGHNLLHSGT